MKRAISSLMLAILAGSAGFAQVKKGVIKKPTLTTKATGVSPALVKASITRGKAVYGTYCISCHQADGGGVPNLNAPLIHTSQVLGNKTQLINIILKGMQGVDIDGESYSNVMPPASHLSDEQIADVLTYIRNSFGNKASAVTLADVKAVRK